jgi:alpha-galactosidase/6-phospho-beta-glucosidase family protein
MSRVMWEIPCPKCGLVVAAALNGDVAKHPSSGAPCTYVHGDADLHYELSKALTSQLADMKRELGVTPERVAELKKTKVRRKLTPEERIARKRLKLAKKRANKKANKEAETRATRVSKQEKEAIAEYWEKRRSGYREVQGGSPGSGKRS